MQFHSPVDRQPKRFGLLPWLHCTAALLAIASNAILSALHSPLGLEISAGESPGLAWIRANIFACLAIGLGYLAWVGWIQLRSPGQSAHRAGKWLLSIELLGVGAVGVSLYIGRPEMLAPAFSVLIPTVLAQGLIAFGDRGGPGLEQKLPGFRQRAADTIVFLTLLFIIGALAAGIEPSWQRAAGQIRLDSKSESLLRYAFPAVLSGTLNVWFGIGMLALVKGLGHLLRKLKVFRHAGWARDLLVFFFLIAAFAAFLMLTLYHAMSWQIARLHLTAVIWQLILFLSVSGAMLLTGVLNRLAGGILRQRQSSLTGAVSLTLGAAVIFPLTWLLTARQQGDIGRVVLPAAVLGACAAIICGALFGGMFNPWFTSFSSLKGAL